MRDFLQKLIHRQQLAIAGHRQDSDTSNNDRQKLTSLSLAHAALVKADISSRFPDHPKQIVVIGPTQVGKSSVVNMLIGQPLADASPIAGHTVHCQGYLLTRDDKSSEQQEWLDAFFGRHSQRSQSSLDRAVLSEFSMTVVCTNENPLMDMVVWDTPDFDSVDSLSYSEPVLAAIALADLVVLVVSKEKYADKSVWNLLRFLQGLDVPVFPVMNKTSAAVRGQLADSFSDKYGRINQQSASPELRFIDDYRDNIELAGDSAEIHQLRNQISSVVDRRGSDELKKSTTGFIEQHWNEWTLAIVAEHDLRVQWNADVDLICDEAVQIYQREYLQHDRYKETFQLALAELLALLEVPGIAEPITKLRSIVTWPVRKIKEAAETHQKSSHAVQDDRTEERRLLEQLGDHVLTQLAGKCSERKAESAYWQTIEEGLVVQQPEVLDAYHRGLDSYQIMLQGEVERAAQSLYRKLEEQPATLTKLRAARVTADAAAIVLAVKSGGLGAIDLVLAPAMLSLTTMLTEGALGKYMESVQNDLRRYQKREMTVLINKKLRNRLKSIGNEIDRSSEHHISPEQLSAAADACGFQKG